MAYDDYLKAQKLALKAYKNKTVRGAYPYLPVLDEILSHVRIEREEILGTVNIPLKQVVEHPLQGVRRHLHLILCLCWIMAVSLLQSGQHSMMRRLKRGFILRSRPMNF